MGGGEWEREKRAEDLPEATLPGLEGVWGGRKGLSVSAIHPTDSGLPELELSPPRPSAWPLASPAQNPSA